MKKLLLIILSCSTIVLSSCKKEEKTYLIQYDSRAIGPGSIFTVYYIKNGETLSQQIIGTNSWSTSFTAKTGDLVSIKCTSPSRTDNFVAGIYLSISKDGTLIQSSMEDFPNTSDVHFTLD